MRKFENPEIDVIEIAIKDVITTSLCEIYDGNPWPCPIDMPEM